MSAEGKWGFARYEDAERWSGWYDSRDHAIADAVHDLSLEPGQTFWVGEYCPPIQPEEMVFAQQFIDQLSDNSCDYDDYCIEAAADWLEPTQEQKTELEQRLRKVTAQWFDEHNLRPQFGLIKSTEKVIATEEMFQEDQ